MFALLWNLCAAVSGYLRVYAPTNRVIHWLRTPRGLRWAFPVALVATHLYLGLTWLAAQGVDRLDLGALNVLVLLFGWNAMKFAWMVVLSPLLLTKHAFGGV